MVQITDAVENARVQNVCGDYTCWLGLIEVGAGAATPSTSQIWRWADGTAAAYTNWYRGQPENGRDRVDKRHATMNCCVNVGAGNDWYGANGEWFNFRAEEDEAAVALCEAPVSDALSRGAAHGMQLYKAVSGAYHTDTVAESCHPPCEALSTLCCDSTGHGVDTGCQTGSYTTSVEHCLSEGLQLCTASQLRSGASGGSGCGLQSERIWSSDGCEATAASDCKHLDVCVGLDDCFDDLGDYDSSVPIRAPDWTAIVIIVCAGVAPWLAVCFLAVCMPLFCPQAKFSIRSLLLCGNQFQCCCQVSSYTVHNQDEFTLALERHEESVKQLEADAINEGQVDRTLLRISDGQAQVTVSIHPATTGADVLSLLKLHAGTLLVFADTENDVSAPLLGCGIVEGGLLLCDSSLHKVLGQMVYVVPTPLQIELEQRKSNLPRPGDFGVDEEHSDCKCQCCIQLSRVAPSTHWFQGKIAAVAVEGGSKQPKESRKAKWKAAKEARAKGNGRLFARSV